MTLAELAKKAAALPDCDAFTWPGEEHFSEYNFAQATETPEEMRAYLDALRKRMADYSHALADLGKAYRQMRDLLLSFSVESH